MNSQTKEAKKYWTYKNKAGFHICDYVWLTHTEAKKKYGKALCKSVPYLKKLNLS